MWINQIIYWFPIGIIGVIALGLLYMGLRKGEILEKTVRKALILVISIYIIQIIAKTIYLYFVLKDHPLGQYLLSGDENNYFYRTVWSFIVPHIWALVIGIGIVIVLLLFKKFTKDPIIDRSDIFIIILTILAVGPYNSLVLFIGALFLMIVVQVINFQKKKFKRLRLSISPFLLIMTIIILVLNNFYFYQKFLDFFKLL